MTMKVFLSETGTGIVWSVNYIFICFPINLRNKDRCRRWEWTQTQGGILRSVGASRFLGFTLSLSGSFKTFTFTDEHQCWWTRQYMGYYGADAISCLHSTIFKVSLTISTQISLSQCPSPFIIEQIAVNLNFLTCSKLWIWFKLFLLLRLIVDVKFSCSRRVAKLLSQNCEKKCTDQFL